MNEKPVKTRFAPSPTGVLHIGSARTALFNFLFTKKHNGSMILRIEDTDKVRSKQEFEDNIIKNLDWLGISHEEMYHQSKRGEVYKKYLSKLIENGSAYVSEEKGGKSDSVIRFKNSGEVVIFHDLVRGDVSMDTSDLGDFVIAKDMDTPLYHLAVVVDDFEMGITHIIRGEDGISNTPRQILIQKAIGANLPEYAHIPLILAPDRSKLSKRHGAVSLDVYRESGYLPEAMINYLSLLGWNPGGEEEIFSLQEIIEKFNLSKVQKGGAVFNEDKLLWINKEHIKRMPAKEFQKKVKNILVANYDPHVVEEKMESLTPIILDRIEKISDIQEMMDEGEFAYYFHDPILEKDFIINPKERGEKGVESKTKELISDLHGLLEGVPTEAFTKEKVKDHIWDFASKMGRGSVLWPMRYALSGRERSPDPFELSEILGKEVVLRRIKVVINTLK